MKRYAITMNGIARMMHAQGGINPLNEVAKWSPARQAAVTAVREIGDADIPGIYAFNDAWEDDGTNIVVNMTKARPLHMDCIRKARDAELIVADSELKKAEDAADAGEVARIRTKRQSLRDLPQTFDLTVAATPEALDALWPAGLARPA